MSIASIRRVTSSTKSSFAISFIYATTRSFLARLPTWNLVSCRLSSLPCRLSKAVLSLNNSVNPARGPLRRASDIGSSILRVFPTATPSSKTSSIPSIKSAVDPINISITNSCRLETSLTSLTGSMLFIR
ncbi:hypothetical protein D3C76_1044630 [compost metagenome]